MSLGGDPRPRPGVFVTASIVLVLSAIVFSRSEFSEEAGGDGAGPPESQPSLVAQRVAAETARLHAQVERSARRFLAAFLRYEVGDVDAHVRREVRATATPQLGEAMLAAPPRAPEGEAFPPPARLRSLDVTFVDSAAFNAYVDGSALRGGELERFSFEFEYTEGEWRASGFTQ